MNAELYDVLWMRSLELSALRTRFLLASTPAEVSRRGRKDSGELSREARMKCMQHLPRKVRGKGKEAKRRMKKKLHLMVSSALGRTIMKMNYPLEGSFYCTLKFAFLFFGRVFPAKTSGLRVFEQNGVEAFEGWGMLEKFCRRCERIDGKLVVGWVCGFGHWRWNLMKWGG